MISMIDSDLKRKSKRNTREINQERRKTLVDTQSDWAKELLV